MNNFDITYRHSPRFRNIALKVITIMLAMMLLFGAIPGSSRAHSGVLTDKERVGVGISGKLEAGEQVPVVIALRETPSMRTNQADIDRLINSVGSVQDQVLGNLNSNEFQVKYKYQAVPAIAGNLLSISGLEKLAANPNVIRVDQDQGGSGALAESVPLIHADNRHALGNTGNGVVVAVLDSGLDTDHDDLSDDLIFEICFGDDDGLIDGAGFCPNNSDRQSGTGAAEDGAGHGTHVTGIITSNGTHSSVGVAPDAEIVAIKVTDDTSFSGSFYFFAEIVAALDWIITSRPDVDVINMSLVTDQLFDGDCDASTSWNIAGANAINTLRANGVIAFASSGNNGDGTSMSSPACLSNVVSVGATDKDDNLADLTNSNVTTDIMAPGISIVSSGLSNGTTTASGTSMAAPHAAGCAALLIETGTVANPDQIETYLEKPDVQVTDATNGLTFPRIECDVFNVSPILFGSLYGWDLEGSGFSPYGEVEVEVYDGSTLIFGPEVTQAWDGYININVGNSVTLAPDYLARATDINTGQVKELVLVDMLVTEVDVLADTVSGLAPALTELTVYIESGHIVAERPAISDASGYWQADFSGIYDILEDDGVFASICDDDGDCTQVYPLRKPHAQAGLIGDWVEFYYYKPQDVIEYEIRDASDVLLTSGQVLADYRGWGYLGRADHGLDFLPGDSITAIDPTRGVSTTLVLQDIAITGVDYAGDIVTGTATANINLELFTSLEGGGAGGISQIPVLADSNGDWMVDLLNDHGIDLTVDRWVSAVLNDEDGDSTFAAPDGDADEIENYLDNAFSEFNPDQSDLDQDGVGDVSDPCPSDYDNTCDPNRSASVSVGDDGGLLSTPDNTVSIDIPAGALETHTSISITDLLGENTRMPSTSINSVEQVYAVVLGPYGITFATPVTVTFTWPDQDGDGLIDGINVSEDSLSILKDGLLVSGPCSQAPGCDPTENTFSMQVSSFGEFILQGNVYERIYLPITLRN